MLRDFAGKPLGAFRYTYMLKMQIRITLAADQE
jgi:hypothetical protein